MKPENFAIAIAIFIALVSITLDLHENFQDGYDLEETNNQNYSTCNGCSIIQALQLTSARQTLINITGRFDDIGNPASDELDKIGSYLAIGGGIIKFLTWDLINFPPEAIGIIMDTYTPIPRIISELIGWIIEIKLLWILFKLVTGRS